MKTFTLSGLDPDLYPGGVRTAEYADAETEQEIIDDTCDSMGIRAEITGKRITSFYDLCCELGKDRPIPGVRYTITNHYVSETPVGVSIPAVMENYNKMVAELGYQLLMANFKGDGVFGMMIDPIREHVQAVVTRWLCDSREEDSWDEYTDSINGYCLDWHFLVELCEPHEFAACDFNAIERFSLTGYQVITETDGNKKTRTDKPILTISIETPLQRGEWNIDLHAEPKAEDPQEQSNGDVTQET